MPDFGSWRLIKTAGFRALFLLVFGLSFFAAGEAWSAEPGKSEVKYLIKLGTIAPENSSWGDSAKQTSKEVLKRTNGQVKIVYYFGAVMGDEPDMIRKIRLGQLQGAVFTLAGAGKIVPEIRVLSLPFLFNNYAEADYVLSRMSSTIDKIFADKGFVTLALADIGFSRSFSKIPLRNEDDFGRAKAWSWSLSGEPVSDETFKLMGVKNFIPLPLTDILSSLQTGLVDVVYGTCYTTIGLQWHTQVKYMSKLKTNFSPGAILIDQKVFNDVPPEYQQIIKEVTQASILPLRKLIRSEEDKACEALKNYGLIEVEPDSDFVTRLKSKSGSLYDKFADIYYPRWLLTGILKAIQQYRTISSTSK